MRKRLEKPPRFVYSVFGETGEKPEVWYVISFSEEDGAIKACNSMNLALKQNKCHYDNYEKIVQMALIAQAQIKPVDEKAKVEFPGARYSMIRYTYDEAKEKNRLPPGVK